MQWVHALLAIIRSTLGLARGSLISGTPGPVLRLCHHLCLCLFNLLLIVFLKIEDDLLNGLVDECSSPIGLVERQLLCGWRN